MAEAFSRLSLSVDVGGGEDGRGGGGGFGPAPVQPVFVAVSPVTPTLPSKPCKLFVDVRCERGPERVRFLAFRNLYTAYITVKARVSGASSASPSPASASHAASASTTHASHHHYHGVPYSGQPKQRWHDLVTHHRCMEDPHYEDDAQALHVVELPGETVDGVPLERVTALRIYLYQPSPRWAALNIGIRHVAAFSSGTPRSIRLAMLTHIAWQTKNGGGHGGDGMERGEAADMGLEWDDDWGGNGNGMNGAPRPGTPGSRAGSPAMGSPTVAGALEPATVAGIFTACADVRSALKSVSKVGRAVFQPVNLRA